MEQSLDFSAETCMNPVWKFFQFQIGNHVLSLNLTPQQKEKVQGYLSKLSPEEQQAQLATFLRLQAQQQLQNQIRAQVQNQQQQQTQKLLTTQNTATQLQQQSKIPTTVQVQVSMVKFDKLLYYILGLRLDYTGMNLYGWL